jgi:hypothetical protein
MAEAEESPRGKWNYPPDTVLQLNRGSCYGSCPAYTVSLTTSGLVHFSGVSNVATLGQATRQIAPEKVSRLIDQFVNHGFFGLGERNCKEFITDLPTYTTTLVWKGRKQTILDYVGCRGGYPEWLRELEDAIDREAETQEWIRRGPDAWTSANPGRRVDGNKLYVNDQLYAELILIGSDADNKAYRGIAIHYVDKNQYAWISPRKGWQLQEEDIVIDKVPDVAARWPLYSNSSRRIIVLKGYTKVSGDSFNKIEYRSDARFANDGSEVLYREAGLFGPRWKAYKVRQDVPAFSLQSARSGLR